MLEECYFQIKDTKCPFKNMFNIWRKLSRTTLHCGLMDMMAMINIICIICKFCLYNYHNKIMITIKLDIGSCPCLFYHVRPSARPPMNISGNFSALSCAGTCTPIRPIMPSIMATLLHWCTHSAWTNNA